MEKITVKMETQDFKYVSTQNLIVPILGDVIEDYNGTRWLVIGRTLKPNNTLIVHTEKIEDHDNNGKH